MRLQKKYYFIIFVLIFAIVLILLPGYIDKRMNRLTITSLPVVSDEAVALHKSLFIGDMHADSLLWKRDLDRRSSYGHVDLPRMRQGGAALQVFSMVSKTPHNLNLQSNAADSDDITLLAMLQLWPVNTWFSLPKRIDYMVSRLEKVAADPGNRFMILHNQADITEFLRKREQEPAMLAGILSVEGAHALAGSLDEVDNFYNRGVRIIGLAHFFDNELGGSQHGLKKGGLTAFGKKAIERMQRLGIIIDLAHSSNATFEDVVTTTKRPVIVTHTGLRGTCDKGRNLTDKQIRQVVATGGIIGVGFWSSATCGNSVDDIVSSIDYAVQIAGVDHVALGSDFDGTVATPFDISGLPVLSSELLRKGFSKEDIGKIMGGNVLRFFRKNLPAA